MATDPPTPADTGTVEGAVAIGVSGAQVPPPNAAPGAVEGAVQTAAVEGAVQTAAVPAVPTAAKRPRRREAENGLPRWRRLHTSREFARVDRQGVRVGGTLLTLTVARGPGRLGLVVSKKVDNRASVRNLIKRRLREIFRQHKDLYVRLPRGAVDVVVTARLEAKEASYDGLAAEALGLLAHALEKLATQAALPAGRGGKGHRQGARNKGAQPDAKPGAKRDPKRDPKPKA